MLGLYFSARSYGEVERQRGIAAFAQAYSGSLVEVDATPDQGSIGPAALAGRTPDQTTWSRGRIQAHAAQASEPQESLSLPAAVLRIPRLRLEVPVYADASERNLNRGAGLVAGTATPGDAGNVALAAHRDGYFRVLEKVVIGDVVQLDSPSGHLQYRVTGISIVEPTDLWPLAATDVPTVTLVTCYPFYFVGSAPQRYIVQAVVVD